LRLCKARAFNYIRRSRGIKEVNMKKKTVILGFALLLGALTAVQAQTSGTFGEGLSWALSGSGTLTISGSGTMPTSMTGGSPTSGGAYQPWVAVKNQIKSVVIEDGVSGVLSVGAFAGCANLTQVTIGKGITNMRAGVFRDSGITSITIPEQISDFDPDTFAGAAKLETVYYNAINCGDFTTLYVCPTFQNTKCPALKTVVIGDSVLRIPASVFSSITTLTSLTIGKGVTEIAERAFQYCSNLQTLVIPGNVQTIGHAAFAECNGLTSLTLEDGINHIGATAFTGAKLTELTIPASVSELRSGAFGNFSRLETVYFNATNCENLDVDSPFTKCEVLTTLIFGDNVRQLPKYIGENLTGLESVTLGRRITQIGQYAFAGCTYLMEVTNNSPRPYAFVGLGNGVFENVDKSYVTVRVPASAVAAYKAANLWKDFTIEAQ
jgi:hypothetical protein